MAVKLADLLSHIGDAPDKEDKIFEAMQMAWVKGQEDKGASIDDPICLKAVMTTSVADYLGAWLSENLCRGCQNPAETIYCAKCAEEGRAKCPHGEDAADCNACMVESDLAYDAARETAQPTKGRD